MYLDYEEPFIATENRFEFALGFLQMRPWMFVDHDPRIGQVNMRRVEMDSRGDQIIFNKYPLDVLPCDPEQQFLQDETQNMFQ